MLSKPIFFYVTDIKFKMRAESKGWMHALDCCIFDGHELQLVAKVNVKTVENLRIPIWHFDDGWKHEGG